MFKLFRRWPSLRRVGVVAFVLPIMFTGGSLISNLAAQSVGGVGSLEIPRDEFNNAYRQIEEEIREQYSIDGALPPEAAQAAISQAQSRLLSEYLFRAAIADKQIQANDVAIATEIRRQPDFQDSDNEFSLELYNDYVTDRRIFEAQVKLRLERRPLLDPLTSYEIPVITRNIASYRQQQRIVERATVAVTTAFNISNENIASYYRRNQRDYAIPEEADWQYIIISSDMFFEAAVPDEETIELAYEELIEELSAQEQRTARHIYIDGDDARARADKVFEQAQNAPDSFADLARKFSDDAGSADNGGLLGIVLRGDLPDAMEAALFDLKLNEISEPVAVEGGFSILMLETITQETPTVESITDEVAEYAKQIIARDELLTLIETLQETADINIGSLTEVAQQAKTEVLIAAAIPAIPDNNATEFFNDPEILAQLYAPEIVTDGETSDAIALDDDTYLMARSARYQAASARPINSVSDSIRKILNANAQIDALLDNDNPQPSLPNNLSWSAPYTLSVNSDNKDDAYRRDINQIFSASLLNGFPAYALVANENGSIDAFRISKIKNNEPQEEDIEQISELLKSASFQTTAAAYQRTLANVYDIYFNLPQ